MSQATSELMRDVRGIVAEPSAEEENKLRQYLQVLLKRKWLILMVTVLVIGAAALWTFSRTRIYRAKATLLISQRAPQVLGKEVSEVVEMSSGSFWRNKEHMLTQERVLRSMTLARRVARSLNLARDKSFWGAAFAQPDKKRTVEDAAKRLRALVRASRVRGANILQVAVDHESPKMAARLANAMTKEYMQQNLEYKLSSTVGAVKWLSDQLDDLKKELEKAELALYEFKKKNNVISVSFEDKQSLLRRRGEALNEALTQLQIKRMSLEARRREIQAAVAKANGDVLKLAANPVMASNAVQRLKRRYMEQRTKYESLRERYLDAHPLVRQAKIRVSRSRTDLQREIKNALSAAKAEYREAVTNEKKLAGALQAAKDDALSINRREVVYRRLKRNQEHTAKLYQLVLTRLKESDLSSQLRVSNIRQLDRAQAPLVPVSPRIKLNLLLGTVLGLLLGIGLAFLVDLLDTTIKSQDEVEAISGLMLLGRIPRIPGTHPKRSGKRPDPKPEFDLIVHRDPKSAIAEACRSIRTNLLFASPDRALRTILVTSPGPREGKTTTAASLAITMAQSGGRVLLIDTDMRRPRVHRIFGVPGGEGVTSVLLGDSALADVVKTTDVPNLFALPCGPLPPNPAELCLTESFKKLVAEAGHQFDRVVLDSPPVMVVTDAVVLSTLVDGVVVVARGAQTARIALRDTVRQVSDVGARHLGVVLNDMDQQRRGYGYYRYRRYGGYGRYGYGNYGDSEEEAAS